MQRILLRRDAWRLGRCLLWLAVAGLLVALPARAHSQEAEGSGAGLARCVAQIDGHVVDAESHLPIAGANVRVDGEVTTVTDGEGHFVLKGLCRRAHVVAIGRIDYDSASREVLVKGVTSLEMELQARRGETVVIRGQAVERPAMGSTAKVSGKALERTRGRSFSDALAEVPGVSQLRSASGMAKPIVRGQFGRRLLLLVDSVPHRSQEWGLDHAPEIDPFSAGELKVVRGAAGVRYGPGAIGGAVITTPPKLLQRPGVAGEAHLMGFFERGAGLAARLQVAPELVPGLAYQLEVSGKRLASPSAPDYVLQNTASSELSLAGTVGYRFEGSEYTLSYRHYRARLGVCACLQIESSEDFFAQLERARPINSQLFESSLRIERAYQQTKHDQAIARGRWNLDRLGKLAATYSFQFDHRSEFDVVRDARGPQFDFRLSSHDFDLVLNHRPVHLNAHTHLRGSIGTALVAQVNSYRGLPLVPDYDAFGGGVFLIERILGHDFELEAGLRYDFTTRNASLARSDFQRLVRSEQLQADACGDGGDSGPVDCGSVFHTLSASAGGLLQISKPWSIKLDLSTASRPPSPDEQYLNGTSPTFPVLGLGKPDLNPETTYSASLSSSVVSERVSLEVSGYTNLIRDYIQFAPAIDASGEPIFDVLIRGSFPRFVTSAVDAVFYGADGGVAMRPIPSLELAGQFSLVRGKKLGGGFLVLVPSDRVRGSATYTHAKAGEAEEVYLSLAGTLVARQSRFDPAADLASPPDGYFLLDAELGGTTRVGKQDLKLAVHGTNLLGARYRDYTSLLRYFADQPGMQVMLRLTLNFSLAD